MTPDYDYLSPPGGDDPSSFPPNPGMVPSDEEGAFTFMGIAALDRQGLIQAAIWARQDAPDIGTFFKDDFDPDYFQAQLSEFQDTLSEALSFFVDFSRLDPRGLRRSAYTTAQQALAAIRDSGLKGTEYAQITNINGFWYVWVDPKVDTRQARRRRRTRKTR